MKTSMLDLILDSELSVRYQPIFANVNGEWQVDSVEALIRGPKGTLFEQANLLFDYVRRKKAENAVDHACLKAICADAVGLPPQVRINVNVHASTLGLHPRFAEAFQNIASRHSLSMDRFTMEIVEYAPQYDLPKLSLNLAELRAAGVKIALDDVGLGHSNYRMMLDCDPDYFKIDGYFVRGVKDDRKRRAVVESILAFGNTLGSAVVAEAANSLEDIAVLVEMGVPLMQCNCLCPALTLQELFDRGVLVEPAHTDATAQASKKTSSRQSAAPCVIQWPATQIVASARS